MSRWIFATAVFSLSTLSTPIVAMVVLAPGSFGEFSAVYVVFSLATTLISIAVCEPWSRANRGGHANDVAGNDGYFAAAIVVSLVGGAAVALAAWMIAPGAQLIAISSAATVLGALRLAARYHVVGSGSITKAVVADCFSVAAQIAVLTVLLSAADPASAVYLSWLAGAAAGCTGMVPRVSLARSRVALREWFSVHRRSMLGYAGDTGVVSVKDISLMAVLMSVLGPAGYGLYRALGNVTSPVRTIVVAVRPRLIILGATRAVSPGALFAVVALAVGSGVAAAGVAAAIARTSLPLGTLGAVVEHPVACGLAVAGSLLAQHFSGLCRGFISLRSIVVARIAVSLAAGGLIVIFAFAVGTAGALYGFAATLGVEGLVWAVLLWAGLNRRPPAPAESDRRVPKERCGETSR